MHFLLFRTLQWTLKGFLALSFTSLRFLALFCTYLHFFALLCTQPANDLKPETKKATQNKLNKIKKKRFTGSVLLSFDA